ncbi:hypothetical protein N5J48_11825 [Acinetobacter ursingii]|uniref:hypothetical protein n=1 Tax=Acinetobacter ursingii TaxID=108980 RepID=UPI002449E896|nr:hypothetical protein [Acinetobacter ursingii]MDG9860962.1 hypothetical protein [Acinetobacter ursingii]MDG9892256.1 hypothetical protein [Acinetobacter ursingii]MDH0005969.1 hypothetical protein [Acinetobacter ursingii]MDH0477507.1 hypothetical protein [Acinetobacter ursingii]MDH2118346.1 hypothetical protein [Acinetobacter ursingii]
MKTSINIMNDIVYYSIIEADISFLGTEKITNEDFNKAIASAKSKAEESKQDYLSNST